MHGPQGIVQKGPIYYGLHGFSDEECIEGDEVKKIEEESCRG
jgi:hypothetical protein